MSACPGGWRVLFVAGAGSAIFFPEGQAEVPGVQPAQAARHEPGKRVGPHWLAPADRGSRPTGRGRRGGLSWPAGAHQRLGLPAGLAPAACRARRLGRLLILSLRSPRPACQAPGRAQPTSLHLDLPVRLDVDQRAVYALLQRGLNNTQIAARLQRKRRWVCYRVAEIKQRLQVSSRSSVRNCKAVIL